MLSVLKNRTYRHLFAAQVIALVGTGLMTVALACLPTIWPGRMPARYSGRHSQSRCWPMSESPRSRRRSPTGCRDGRCSLPLT